MSRLFTSTFFRMLKKIVFWILLIESVPYQWLGYSLLVIVLTSGTGIVLFKKKEIR